jgi:K+-sensing histidine kinase KdpD
MTQVVVPVRYPLTAHSKGTLARAREVAAEHDAGLTVLHVNLYQEGDHATRADLKRAVERAFGPIDATSVVRSGFLVEETILEEVAAERADYVVIGQKQAGRWRRMLRSLIDDPDIETYLREKLDCTVITANATD